MRKVFALFAGLVLLSMLAACSEDSTPTPPAPRPSALSISTTAVPAGCTCNPYMQSLAAVGGTAPYVWSLAATSDPLPQGLVLTSDGRISGVVTSSGDFSFAVRCTDNSPTPAWVEKTFTMNVSVPSNPSLAIYYDNGATVCSSGAEAFTRVHCYIFIMLEDSDVYSATACEFKLRLTDATDFDLEPGTQYYITEAPTYPNYVAIRVGDDLFSGMSLGFSRPIYGPEPILVASFALDLMEDLSNLTFKFDAIPFGMLGIADENYTEYNVTGRVSALNY